MKHLGQRIFGNRGNGKGKRFLSALLVAVFLLAVPAVESIYETPWNGSFEAYATTAKEKKKEAEEGLKDTNDTIDDIKNKQDDLEDDIESASADLAQLLKDQEALQGQIEGTQAKVEQANLDLEDAKQREAEEYEAMKLRIQYMYENNTNDSFWRAILESDGISDMLNRVEYVADVYQSDRDLMEKYEQAVQDVEDLTLQLADEMDELLALQEQYETQQGNLEYQIALLEDKREDYADQLALAEQQADEFQKTIEKQDEIIRQQEAAAAGTDSGSYDGGGTGSSGLGSADYLSDPSYDPAFKSSVTGEELVNFALQYVGNPYVWGGNSLTEGCDCSGFVHLVYAHFGFTVPRYSQSFKTVGDPVAYENIKAGDIVVYPGHVAIYIGNGCIVEAQSTKAGITSYRSVNCHTITAIRRVL